MGKKKVFKCPLYPVDIVLIYGDGDYVNHHVDIEDDPDGFVALTILSSSKGDHKNEDVSLIFNESKDVTVGVIAHECYHASNMIFEFIGQKTSLKNKHDEVQAYLLEYLVQETYDFLKKYLK